MGRWVWSEGEMVVLSRLTEVIANDLWLHACLLELGIKCDDHIEILGHVNHYRNIATLAFETGCTAPWQDRNKEQ